MGTTVPNVKEISIITWQSRAICNFSDYRQMTEPVLQSKRTMFIISKSNYHADS